MSGARLHNSRLVRLACLVASVVALAAACFARSSLRLHDAMLAHRIAGPIIHEWQTHRAMPRKVKRVAYHG